MLFFCLHLAHLYSNSLDVFHTHAWSFPNTPWLLEDGHAGFYNMPLFNVIYSRILVSDMVSTDHQESVSLTIRIQHRGGRLCTFIPRLRCEKLMEQHAQKCVGEQLDQISRGWPSFCRRSQYRPLSHNPLLLLASEFWTSAALWTGRPSGYLI